MEAFKIEHLNFTYPGAAAPALCHVDLTVDQGDFWVICGHSGCGKSTLLRQFKPAIAPHGIRTGTVMFGGAPLEMSDDAAAAARIGFVLQSPEAQIVTDKVWHELAFGLENLGCDTPTIRRRCAEMAAFFGIEDWYYQPVAELSGGQKQLLCLAAVMTMQPEVLILDEPTAQLDPIAASDFMAALTRINRELGTTVILSEHRLEEALAAANRAAVMENGRILCAGRVEEVGAYLKTRGDAMFAAMPCAMRVWGSVDSTLSCPITVNEGRRFLTEYTAAHPVRPLCPPARRPTVGEERVTVGEAWFRYERDGADVLRGLTLSARSGELLAVLGGNGSGKTTTLKLLAGALTPYRGDIRVTGRVGLLPQDPRTVFVGGTVYADFAAVLREQGIGGEERDKAIARTAALCRITGLLERHPYDLSGGEQQRAALAKILMISPDILLLDEPTKGLDAGFKEELAVLLHTLTARGICIIMVSHDIEFCAKHADRCGLFFDGQLVTEGEPRVFFAGNSFYTTAANRMARQIAPEAVIAEDVMAVIGGTLPTAPVPAEEAEVMPIRLAHKEQGDTRRLPLWRKIAAAVCGISAAAVALYAANTGSLSSFVSGAGLTAAGSVRLLTEGLFLLLIVLMAIFIGRRSPAALPARPVERRKLPARAVVAAVLILLLVPLTLAAGILFLQRRQYYITALAVLLECMLPFFLVFEGRRPRARELVIIATLCALAVAGRAAFFMLPQVKPVMALTIIAGVAFGGETGFLVGALSMLVSNMLFSQGPWTPWQMFAMGMAGFLAGLLYHRWRLAPTRLSLCLFGVISVFLIFGGITNPSSVFIWSSENISWKLILAYYVTGFPMDCVHAISTALFLWFGAQPMLRILERVKTKYGLLD